MTVTQDRSGDVPAPEGTSDLPARAANRLDLLRRNAARADAERRIPEENIQALAGSGLFSALTPKRLGGSEVDLRTFLTMSSTLGQACGSTAWVTTLIGVCGWLLSLYPEQAQRDVLEADPDARVCGVLTPSATARPVDGGLVVSGEWTFASGCLHAQWAVLGVPLVDESGRLVDQGLVLIPMSDLTIRDTWYVAGMRGTGSNTLVAQDVFVPAHRMFSVPAAIEGRYATEHTEETLYRSAFIPVLALVLVGPLVGLAKGALQDVLGSLAKGRPIAYTFYERAVDAGSTQITMAEAAALVDTAELHMLRAADDIDRAARGGRYPDPLERTRVRMDVGVVVRRTREAMDLLLSTQGAGSFAEANPLQIKWRDLETGSRHAVVNPSISAEAYGRALLGVEPQITPLI